MAFSKWFFGRRTRPIERLSDIAASRAEVEAGPPPVVEGRDKEFAMLIERHSDEFLCPSDLTLDLVQKKVLLIGTCFLGPWAAVALEKRLAADPQLFILGAIDEIPDSLMTDGSDFAFQIIQAPLCAAIPDEYLAIAPGDHAGFIRAFERGKFLVEHFIEAMMKYNKLYGVETYVCNFVTPQAGLHGRFAPRYDLSNIIYFTEEINRFLASFLRRYNNTYLVDVDTIGATFGKKFSCDDFYWQSNHGGTVTDAEEALDASRLRVTPSALALYRSDPLPFVHAAWREIIAMHRTLHAMDLVKMVVIDLDDTLWRGLVGEGEGDASGWPGGLCEALVHLKHRGVLLAIISKNDEAIVRDNWRRILGNRIAIEDFAVVRINYGPKPVNMKQILEAVNLLPRNVVFIDDNPVERDAMRSAYPEIRTLGDVPAYLKRILMWSSETQVSNVSAESAERTTMIQAQIVRDATRHLFNREDFLADLDLTMTVSAIRDMEDRRLARAIELVNKTNQFNTSGLKTSVSHAAEHFGRGGLFYVFTAADKHTNYGLVGVLVCRNGIIEQFVMSCRVAGLDVEKGALATILMDLARSQTVCRAPMRHTAVNLLCRNVFAQAGFRLDGCDTWIKDLTADLPASPTHIAVTFES